MQLGIAHNMSETHLEIRVPPPPAGAPPAIAGKGREVLSFPETFCRDPALFDKAIERNAHCIAGGHAARRAGGGADADHDAPYP